AAEVRAHAQRLLHRRVVGREDGDAAVVLHVDLGAGLLLDAADDLAAWADDLADLFRSDLDGHEAGRVRAQLRARLVECLPHLAEDEHPRLARLLESLTHDVDRHALDFDVHLTRGYTGFGPAYFAFPVAVVITDALAVR